VLPVALNSTRAALVEAKQRYARVIDAPSRGWTFVEAIDDAMDLRMKAESKRAPNKSR
jgi:hypothetical protein